MPTGLLYQNHQRPDFAPQPYTSPQYSFFRPPPRRTQPVPWPSPGAGAGEEPRGPDRGRVSPFGPGLPRGQEGTIESTLSGLFDLYSQMSPTMQALNFLNEKLGLGFLNSESEQGVTNLGGLGFLNRGYSQTPAAGPGSGGGGGLGGTAPSRGYGPGSGGGSGLGGTAPGGGGKVSHGAGKRGGFDRRSMGPK